MNTNSGQLASKLTNQIDAANTHLDASSKILSQQHSGQTAFGKTIHDLHTIKGGQIVVPIDTSHTHVDTSKTHQHTHQTIGKTIHSHNDKLRFVDHTIKGGHGTSVLITKEEEERIENERRKNIVQINSSDKLNSHISTNKTDSKYHQFYQF